MQINNATHVYCIMLHHFSTQINVNGKRMEIGKFSPKPTDTDMGLNKWSGTDWVTQFCPMKRSSYHSGPLSGLWATSVGRCPVCGLPQSGWVAWCLVSSRLCLPTCCPPWEDGSLCGVRAGPAQHLRAAHAAPSLSGEPPESGPPRAGQ